METDLTPTQAAKLAAVLASPELTAYRDAATAYANARTMADLDRTTDALIIAQHKLNTICEHYVWLVAAARRAATHRLAS